MKNYGLIGKKLSHSLSKAFFNQKFKQLNLENHNYENYELENLDNIREFIKKNKLSGLNVTIPFKQKILNYLDKIDPLAKEIGAVNTLKINNDKIFGYNTDIYGFEKSIIPLIDNRENALILGDGGASKTIKFVLEKNKINITTISRRGRKNYDNLTKEDIIKNLIIINTTPLGMYPDIKSFPKIPYKHLNSKHLVYDLIYNPKQTIFLEKAEKQGSNTINGHEMLKYQANKSWNIWQK